MSEQRKILLGKYRVEKVIGKGGMGVVALVHHIGLDQPKAIKFLLPAARANAKVVRRFLQEAQSAAKLKSEHVCRVHDVGTLEDGTPYMVMEYLEGRDLAHVLAERGPLPPGLAADYVLQVVEALAEAHALGIVHRDLKPANFFLTQRADGSPLVKVLDFGISKMPMDQDAGLTNTHTVMGTPSYMSPEQLRSTKQVDARTDIWALGVVLYELLSGRRPFTVQPFSALCFAIAQDPLPPLPPSLPSGLAAIVATCLEKQPRDRFQNVAELATALALFADNSAQAAATPGRTVRILGLAGVPETLASHQRSAPTRTGSQRIAAVAPAHTGSQRIAAVAETQDLPVTADHTGVPQTTDAGAGQVGAHSEENEAPRRGWWRLAMAVGLMAALALALLLARGTALSGRHSERPSTVAPDSAKEAAATGNESSAPMPTLPTSQADAGVPALAADIEAADGGLSLSADAGVVVEQAVSKRKSRRSGSRSKAAKPDEPDTSFMNSRR